MTGLPDTDNKGWHNWAFLYAIVSFGFSQIFLNLVQVNPKAFPVAPGWIFWTLLWLQILPFLLLLAIDRVFRSFENHSTGFVIWRAALCALLCASLIKQFQVFHEELYERYVHISAYAVAGITSALLIPILWFWRRAWRVAQLLLNYAGLLSLALPVLFVYSTYAIPPGIAQIKKPQPAEAAKSIHGPSVYIVVFDELSLEQLMNDQSIDSAAFPNFAALAKDSLWFRNAVTNHWATVNSVPTILTGKVNPVPSDHTIAGLLPASYKRTLIISEIEVENWLRYENQERANIEYRGKAYFLNKNAFATARFILYRLWGFFTFALPENILFDDPEYHVTLEAQEDFFLRQIDGLDSNQFLFWHCSLPHSPFLYGPDGRQHGRNLDFFPFEKEYRKSTLPIILANYRDQMRYADTILGRILDRLKATNRYSKSLLIVTSDHGLRIWGDLFNHIDLIAKIPVFIRIPGQAPRVIDTDFQLSDLAPTLLKALGRTFEQRSFDGYSAFTPHPVRKPAVHFYPSQVMFVFNKEQNQWMAQSSENGKLTSVSLKHEEKGRGFYATQVVEDVVDARKQNIDFLKLYLQNHFPEKVTQQDLKRLRGNIDALPQMTTPATHFKRGMFLFFLALSETQLLSAGEGIDVRTINEEWKQALYELRTAGELNPLLAEEIDKLLAGADKNGDKNLDRTELSNMIRTRYSPPPQ